MRPTAGAMVWRALRRRCPSCGARHLFLSWFRMAPHCPGCGVRLQREEGFFLGTFFINVTVTQVALFAWVIASYALTYPDHYVLAMILGAVAVGVGVPLAFYPFAQALWAACHLAMAPLEPEEEADAAVFRFERGDGA